MLQAPPPTGPKATRTSGRLASSRAPSRGGIQKRGTTPARVDKDGDIAMGAAGAGSRGGGSGRGTAIRGSALNRRHEPLSGRTSRPPRTGINTSAIEKTILRSMGSDGSVSKGPRSSLRGVRGRDRGRDRAGALRDPLEHISITGLKHSRVAGNPDGGVSDLIGFLERKATDPDAPAREAVKIKKSRLEGGNLIISVRPEDTPKIIRLDTFMFAGSTLSIEGPLGKTPPLEGNAESETPNTINILKGVLSRRYNVESKLLDLSQLGSDPELVNIGMFNTTSRESKFFPALMKICDSIFTTTYQKEEAIISVSLANNALPSISSVTTLAQTFPAIKNLDLSNNNIKDLTALNNWRWKFRKLDHLVLTGNPIEAEVPHYRDDMLKWFPSLTTLNTTQLRSSEEIMTATNGKLPIPILGPSFRDEASISESFVKQFFAAYDLDRATLVNGYYDPQSTFSLSINTSAPRAPGMTDQKTPSWESYIKRSRNLTKLTHLPAKVSRLYAGTKRILDAFTTLPATRHPDLIGEPEKWCIECHAIPGLPDPTGQSVSGVGGLTVMVHGQFSEVDVSTGEATVTRSFDRTFVLGPGGGFGGIRIACDMLVLRSYGGHEAWQTEVVDAGVSQPAQPLPLPLPQSSHLISVPPGFAATGPGKSEEQVQKEVLVLELSKGTGMTLEYSQLCLEQSNWDLKNAASAFEQAKPQLPADAFVS